ASPFRRRRSEAVSKRLAVVLIVTMMASGSVLRASAQELRQVDPVVVTATKIAEPRSQVGATVTVISEEELKTYNYLTVDDALRRRRHRRRHPDHHQARGGAVLGLRLQRRRQPRYAARARRVQRQRQAPGLFVRRLVVREQRPVPQRRHRAARDRVARGPD